jgi:hypothetical protein
VSKKPEDLMPQDFPKLSWESNRLSEALNKLFDYSIAEAKRAINWYALKRAPKQLWGRILRWRDLRHRGAGCDSKRETFICLLYDRKQ